MDNIYISPNGNDKNSGVDEAYPRLTVPENKHFDVVMLERGAIYYEHSIPFRSNMLLSSFGDPNKEVPFLHASDNAVITLKDKRNVSLMNIGILGGSRSLYCYDVENILLDNVKVKNSNTNAENSLYFKRAQDVTIINCSNENTFGDFIYGTQSSKFIVESNDIFLPNGGRADGIQFTDENNSKRTCTNIKVNYNKIRGDKTVSNWKGGIAIEGTHDYIVSYNEIVGRVFGIQSSGKNALIEHNIIFDLLSDHQFSFGLGIGAFSADNITIRNNIVMNAKRGCINSNNSGRPNRTNIQMYDNKFINCDIDYFVDVPMTGRIENMEFFGGNS